MLEKFSIVFHPFEKYFGHSESVTQCSFEDNGNSALWIVCSRLIKIKEPAALEEKANAYPYDISYVMGSRLLHSDDGDVKIECSCTDNGARKELYAHSIVLRTRCPYFARSINFSDHMPWLTI